MTGRSTLRGGLAGFGMGLCYSIVGVAFGVAGGETVLERYGISLASLVATYLTTFTVAGAIVGACWSQLDRLPVRVVVYFMVFLCIEAGIQLLIAGGPQNWRRSDTGILIALSTFYTLGMLSVKPSR